MTDRTTVHGLQVATSLYRFVDDKVLPGTGVDAGAFWKGFDAIVADLAPRNIALLAEPLPPPPRWNRPRGCRRPPAGRERRSRHRCPP
ncbi:hypothetical protein ACQKEU_16830, partial [Acidovorax sp. NPDC077664]|uniref:hypothetical protein n=1 Tax=Acidovorax sp. NPDC077664 TaxID=3390544 RepID=UPI003D052731